MSESSDAGDRVDPPYPLYLLRGALATRSDVDVDRVEYDSSTKTVVVEHVAPNAGDDVDEVLRDVYTVIGVFAGVLESEDWDAEAVEGEMWDPDGEDVVAWSVEREWVDRYRDGRWDADDILSRLARAFSPQGSPGRSARRR